MLDVIKVPISFKKSGLPAFIRRLCLAVIIIAGMGYNGFAQNLEPRAFTSLPVGMNFAFASYGYAQGNILFDPSLPLENTDARLNTMVFGYLRSINLFGKATKIDVLVPYGIGTWTGIYQGIDSATSRSGFADMRIRLSIDFTGAPAMSIADYASYKPDMISGFSIEIYPPTGQYYPDRLINLGTNRWRFKPQYGFSKNFDKWIVEAYFSVLFFTKNSDFFGGRTLKQGPVYAFKLHGIRKLKNRSWFALSAGYLYGATSKVNDVRAEFHLSTMRIGLTYAIPVAKAHTLRLTAGMSIAFEEGADFNALAISYQYRWFKK
jgi:hypothetical protein